MDTLDELREATDKAAKSVEKALEALARAKFDLLKAVEDIRGNDAGNKS
jgi:hypothetical protein